VLLAEASTELLIGVSPGVSNSAPRGDSKDKAEEFEPCGFSPRCLGTGASRPRAEMRGEGALPGLANGLRIHKEDIPRERAVFGVYSVPLAAAASAVIIIAYIKYM
jgi:hypothetical protein